MDGDAAVSITAIICLTALEIANLLTLKIDSMLLMAISSIIGGIGGYRVKTWRAKKRR
jgi:hypothetical protein